MNIIASGMLLWKRFPQLKKLKMTFISVYVTIILFQCTILWDHPTILNQRQHLRIFSFKHRAFLTEANNHHMKVLKNKWNYMHTYILEITFDKILASFWYQNNSDYRSEFRNKSSKIARLCLKAYAWILFRC